MSKATDGGTDFFMSLEPDRSKEKKNNRGTKRTESTKSERAPQPASTPQNHDAHHADHSAPSFSSFMSLNPQAPSDEHLEYTLNIDSISDEIRDNAEKYQGAEWINISSFPTVLITVLNILCERIDSRPSRNTIICCALSSGLSSLCGNKSIRDLLEIRSLAHNLPHDSTEVDDLENLLNFLSSFNVGSPCQGSGRRQLTVRLTDWSKSHLHDVSDKLGVSMSTLAVYSIMATVSLEPEHVHPDRIREFQLSVRKLLRMVWRRGRIAGAWIDTLRCQDEES